MKDQDDGCTSQQERISDSSVAGGGNNNKVQQCMMAELLSGEMIGAQASNSDSGT